MVWSINGEAEERRSGRVDPLIMWSGVVALAWLLARSPVILPIPGTSSVEHLEENVAAAGLKIDEDKMQELG